MVLNVQKATENVDIWTRTLLDKDSSVTLFFKIKMIEWLPEPTATLSASGSSISSQNEI